MVVKETILIQEYSRDKTEFFLKREDFYQTYDNLAARISFFFFLIFRRTAIICDRFIKILKRGCAIYFDYRFFESGR